MEHHEYRGGLNAASMLPLPPGIRPRHPDAGGRPHSGRPHKRKKVVCCIACYTQENLLQPCPRCPANYCAECLTDMFRGAVDDKARFPARCCGIIQIHTVLPGLDSRVAKAYRAAFEEWMASKKVYCPDGTCSAFIPERLMPHKNPQATSKEMAAVFPSHSFPCPICKTAICTSCRKLDHRGAECSTKQDDDDAAMVTSLGFKRCPRCGEGVKKMWGCVQMQCCCGASWCWDCLSPIEVCCGDCLGGQAETDDAPVLEQSGEDADHSADIEEDGPTPTRPDAGGPLYWEDSGLDFGGHPDEIALTGQVWSCKHTFQEVDPFDSRLKQGDSRFMECNRCFKACPEGKGAHTCHKCFLLVCGECRQCLPAAENDGEEDDEVEDYEAEDDETKDDKTEDNEVDNEQEEKAQGSGDVAL